MASFSASVFHLLLHCQFFGLTTLTSDSIGHVADLARIMLLGAAPTPLVRRLAASLLMIDSLDFNRLFEGAPAHRLGFSWWLLARLRSYSLRVLSRRRICPQPLISSLFAIRLRASSWTGGHSGRFLRLGDVVVGFSVLRVAALPTVLAGGYPHIHTLVLHLLFRLLR